MYEFTTSLASKPVDHADHAWEEWHAYLSCDDNLPGWIDGDDSGLCCHDCQVIVVEVLWTQLRTDVIYRVIYSPTEFTYATVLPGPGEPEVSFHHSAKRAFLMFGEHAPIVPLPSSEFERLLS